MLAILLILSILLALGYSTTLFSKLGITKGASSQTKQTDTKIDETVPAVDEKEELSCNKDYFLFNGKCLMCPHESKWNGTHCIKEESIRKTFIAKIVRNSSGEFVVENKTLDGEQGWTTGTTPASHLYS